MDKVWMSPPFRSGPPIEVEAREEVLVPLMAQGYFQVDAPGAVKTTAPTTTTTAQPSVAVHEPLVSTTKEK